MIIIFEGMDNTGKTTALGKASRLLGLPVVKSLGKATQEAHVGWLIDLVKRHNTDGHILVDRCPLISEYIYGPVIRGENVMEEVQHAWWNEINGDVMIVYCRPHRDAILDSLHERDQMPGVVDYWATLLERYDDFMTGVRSLGEVPLLVYDYRNDPDATELAGDIYSYIRGK